MSNITINETQKIVINLSASDPNDDALIFLINSSKFSNRSNTFEWHTTTSDNGIYVLKATASDGYLNDSFLFKITILDVLEKDSDNDGIEDNVDRLIGNDNSINTSTLNLRIFVDDSINLSRVFNKTAKLKFKDNNLTIVEFDFDFSLHRLNLSNVTINRQSANATGSLLVRGLKMPQGTTKTLYIDKINATLNGICIKEEEILAIKEISGDCNSNNEFKVECDGTLQSSYSCAYNSTISKYRIQGLRHSGIVQIDYTKPVSESSSSASQSTTSSGGSSGGGGSGITCVSDWQCNEWSQCIDGFTTRKCFDASQCAFPLSKPIKLEQCISDEKKLVDIIKPLEYIDKTLKRIKENIKSREISVITGQTVKTNEKLNAGIFIVFIEVLLIVGTYLAIKASFSSKIFK